MSSPQAARRLARKTYSLQLPLQLASRLEALSNQVLRLRASGGLRAK